MSEITKEAVNDIQDLPRWRKLAVSLFKTAQRGLEMIPGFVVVGEEPEEASALAELEVERQLRSL